MFSLFKKKNKNIEKLTIKEVVWLHEKAKKEGHIPFLDRN